MNTDNIDTEKYYFDERAANLAVFFIENYLYHIKGKFAGKKFKLQEWQKNDIIKPLFGWKRKVDNTRKYRTAYIFLPRKNGKSTLVAAIVLLILLTDKELGAEIYSAAADAKQASIIFNVAKEMIRQSKLLSSKVEIYKNSIVYPKYAGIYQTISSTAGSKHGFDTHVVVVDELHAQKNRELWDVLTTSTAARKQPLVVAITTAGSDRNSIAWEVHEYAEKVASGEIIDDTFLPVLYGASEDDDWTDPEVWKKANPGIGNSIYLSYLEEQCEKAKKSVALENSFRRLHLNQWLQQSQRWMPMFDWNKCNRKVKDTGSCWVGLDLARTTDLCSISYVFPHLLNKDEVLKDKNVREDWEYHVKVKYFLPKDNIEEKERRDRVNYRAWEKKGLITLCDGPVVSYDEILETIINDSKVYDIKQIAFDRYGSSDIVTKLVKLRFKMVEFGQGFISMNTPTNKLLEFVLTHKLVHGGNEILTWNANNLVVKRDAAGNIKPDKELSRNKIDGIVATIMGLDRAIKHKGEISTYSLRGLRTV